MIAWCQRITKNGGGKYKEKTINWQQTEQWFSGLIDVLKAFAADLESRGFFKLQNFIIEKCGGIRMNGLGKELW
mgnify:CR=1 FL=1